MKRIIVFGTGKYGKKTYKFLKDIGCNIDFFCKSYVEKDEYFEQIKVLSLRDLSEYDKENMLIFVAVYDKKKARQVIDIIKKNGISDNQIININDSLRQDIMVEKNSIDGSYFCNCCNSNVKFFSSGGESSSLFDRYHIIGGGYRENVICPNCGAMDRVRWQNYVLTHFTDILDEKCNVLHIAPEEHIYKLIHNNVDCDYYPCDIELSKAQHRCDLTNIQFKDNFFDYIIANHVLEHIKRIDMALSEVRRVLKPNGKFIISFPICMELKTWEETGDLSNLERLEKFGQEDHVRLFGYDYREYIERYGFHVNTMLPEEVLDAATILKYGLIRDDVILICSKCN